MIVAYVKQALKLLEYLSENLIKIVEAEMYRQFINETNNFAVQILEEKEKVIVKKSSDELTVFIDGIGKATGTISTIDDEETAYEGYPLGLSSYGKKEADKIYKILDDDYIETILYLSNLSVGRKFRGKGYAKKLMDAFEGEAKKMRIDAILGNASPHGAGADRVPFSVLKTVYTRLGYIFLTVYKNENGLIYKKI